MIDLVLGTTVQGDAVAECVLGDAEVPAVIERASSAGAAILWIHCDDDLTSFGFTERPGFTRMTAAIAPPPPPEALERLSVAQAAALGDQAFQGLWGHKRLPEGADLEEIFAGSLAVGLRHGDTLIGLCTVFPEPRIVDAPGVRAGYRSVERHVRLLRAGANLLGQGPITLHSWGDADEVIEAYVSNGFTIEERVRGWELRLPRSSPAEPGEDE